MASSAAMTRESDSTVVVTVSIVCAVTWLAPKDASVSDAANRHGPSERRMAPPIITRGDDCGRGSGGASASENRANAPLLTEVRERARARLAIAPQQQNGARVRCLRPECGVETSAGYPCGTAPASLSCLQRRR